MTRPRIGITDVQQGVVGQQLFSTYAILSSGGRLELSPALTDDERRDFEVHIRGEFVGIGVQVKTSISVVHGRSTHHRIDYLNIRFPIRVNRINNDPRYWYFLASTDVRAMSFRTPQFLVPAEFIHKFCRYGPVKKGHIRIVISASLAADSRDRWVPYRIPTIHDIGPKLEAAIRTLPKSLRTSREEAARLWAPADQLHLRQQLQDHRVGAEQQSPDPRERARHGQFQGHRHGDRGQLQRQRHVNVQSG